MQSLLFNVVREGGGEAGLTDSSWQTGSSHRDPRVGNNAIQAESQKLLSRGESRRAFCWC